jgi:hypothetical protein
MVVSAKEDDILPMTAMKMWMGRMVNRDFSFMIFGLHGVKKGE